MAKQRKQERLSEAALNSMLLDLRDKAENLVDVLHGTRQGRRPVSIEGTVFASDQPLRLELVRVLEAIRDSLADVE